MSNPIVRLSHGAILRLLNGFRVQVQTEVGLWELEQAADEAWQPLRRVPMSPAVQDAHRKIGMDPEDMEIWANDTYEAFLKPMDDGAHLSVKRYDRQPCHNWRHLQQIKNEVVGEEREAVELYPRESRIADNANQFHLWVLPEGLEFPFGFSHGFFLTDDEIARFNRNGDPARQEPVQEGLTIGQAILRARADGTAPPELEKQVGVIVDGGLGRWMAES